MERGSLLALLEHLMHAALNRRRSAATVVHTADCGTGHGQAHLALVAAARVVLQLLGGSRELRLHHDVRDARISLNIRLIEAVSVESLQAHGHSRLHVGRHIKSSLRVNVRVLLDLTHTLIAEVERSTSRCAAGRL